jgi:hypothetical protein
MSSNTDCFFCDCFNFGCFSSCSDIQFVIEGFSVIAPIEGDYIIHYSQDNNVEKSRIVSFLINEPFIFPSDLFSFIGNVKFSLEVPGGSLFEFTTNSGDIYDCFSFDRKFINSQPQQI